MPHAEINAGNLTDEKNQRHSILLGNMDTDGSVGRTRPPTDEFNRGPTRILGVRNCHKSATALLAYRDHINIWGIIKSVYHPEITLARDTKHPVNAVNFEGVNQDVRGSSHTHFLSFITRMTKPLMCLGQAGTYYRDRRQLTLSQICKGRWATQR